MKYYGKFTDEHDLIHGAQAKVVVAGEISRVDSPLKEALDGKQNNPTVVTGTLTAGQTSLVLSNAAFTTSSIIDIYTDVYGVSPKTAVLATGTLTLTFKEQASNLGVRVEVR